MILRQAILVAGMLVRLIPTFGAAGLVTVASVTAELRPAHSKATGYPGEGVVFGMDDFGPTSRSTLKASLAECKYASYCHS